jgi:DNA polymerase-3 subunit gamma/tau
VEYQALYRKYRPQRFAEIVGQDHVTLTLAREVQNDRIAHAYLFAGPRGTGKTTTARIIAKALNCENRGVDGEPDATCSSCTAIAAGTSLDVIELDAASHNKVEDVREIRANVGTVASVGGARRVYILDEAHMLSRAASNALLKTLEEPPEHAHFVLATTEPYKLPDTIRSRTQRFDFHPIGADVLIGHLERIARLESMKAAPDGLSLVARHAKGSVRDALGLLEQVAALGGGTVDAKAVTRALGLADTDAFARLATAVTDRNASAALGLVAEIASEGADLRRFVADAIEFFRGVFLALYAPNLEEILDDSADTIAEYRAHARTLDAADVLRSIDLLGDALVQLREGREERLVTELTLLRLARPETSLDAASLAARVDRLEDRLRRFQEQGPVAAADTPAPASPPKPIELPPEPAPAPAPAARPLEAEASEPAPPEQDEPAPEFDSIAAEAVFEAPIVEAVEAAPQPTPVVDVDMAAIDALWPALVARVRDEAGPRRHALFRETAPAAVEDGALVLEVPAHLPFHLAQLQEDDRLMAILTSVVQELSGAPLRVRYRSGDGAQTGLFDTPVDIEPERAPDKDDLQVAGSGGVDPTDILKDMLGGEVVDDA